MTATLPEIDLGILYRLREGDEAAFGALYRLCAPALYQRLLRLFKDVDVTEEILQDVFLRIWEKRAQIDPERGFRTYLYRIADNLAMDVFRRISRDKVLQQELWAQSVSVYLLTDELSRSTDEFQLVNDAIDRLPPKRKQILVLCKLEEKSYQEVADLMGISVSTVSNQLVKAVREIRQYVTQSAGSQYSAVLLLMAVFNEPV